MKTQMNRRNFLKAATVTAGTALAFPHIGRCAENRKLRIALIGVGGRGDYGLSSVKKEDVVALCDVDTTAFTRPSKRLAGASAVDLFPRAKKYRDYRELFEHADDFDAVWVATPDHHHYPASIRAIRAGKAVYCEKPLSWSIWESQQLAAEAEKYKVATQLGNQGMSNNGWRLAHAYIAAGAIGEVKEVHTWTGRHGGWFSDGILTPEGKDPVPENLDWDLWLGPAPVRPYLDNHYHPRRWRGWIDFGNGALGDWCCHLMNAYYKILEPGYPTSVECIAQTGPAIDSYPVGKTVKWEFPSKGNRPGFISYWYDGSHTPPRPAALEEGRELRSSGSYILGTRGTIWFSGGYNDSVALIPDAYRKSFGKQEIVIPRKNHTQEFLEAAKGLIPYDAPLSHFGYGAKLTSSSLMANIAARVKGKLLYDSRTLRFTNSDRANELCTRKPRPGWYI
jgi:predicted dehydrogenase